MPMTKAAPWTSICLIACALGALVVANTKAGAAQAQKVPEALVDVGEFGENAYDLAKAGDWPKVNDKVEALKEAAKKLTGDLKDAKAEHKRLGEVLTALAKAAAAKDKLAAMREANQITKIAADLSEPFNPQVPAGVARLDFYGRELELGTATKDKTQLKAAAEGLRKNWDKLRAGVTAKGGAAEAKRFDALVTSVETAKTVEDYGKLVTPILDEVDNLEKVFKK
jgi:hypothetical protein